MAKNRPLGALRVVDVWVEGADVRVIVEDDNGKRRRLSRPAAESARFVEEAIIANPIHEGPDGGGGYRLASRYTIVFPEDW